MVEWFIACRILYQATGRRLSLDQIGRNGLKAAGLGSSVVRGLMIAVMLSLPLRAAVLGVWALSMMGCVNVSRPIVPSPLTYSEQEKEVLAKVPIGTPKAEAMRQLQAAGIEGSYGSSQRIYYCDLWNRPNGDRWHMNVALLFDESGKVYKAQMGESQIRSAAKESSLAERQQAERSKIAEASSPTGPPSGR